MSAPGAASQRSTKPDFDGQQKVAPRENKAFNCELRAALCSAQDCKVTPAHASCGEHLHFRSSDLLAAVILSNIKSSASRG